MAPNSRRTGRPRHRRRTRHRPGDQPRARRRRRRRRGQLPPRRRGGRRDRAGDRGARSPGRRVPGVDRLARGRRAHGRPPCWPTSGTIDILVNNAGIALPRQHASPRPTRPRSSACWPPTPSARTTSAACVLPGMRTSRAATSCSSRRSPPTTSRPAARPYSMGKAAMEALALHPRQGGAAPRHPREHRRPGAGRDRDGPAAGEGRWRRGHHDAPRRTCRSGGCASPRTSPTSCASSCPTRGSTSAASASASTAAAR